MIDPAALALQLEQLSYAGIYLFGASIGLLLPVPEEIFLILLGYLAGSGLLFGNLYFACVLALCGVMTGDLAIYLLARGGRQGTKFMQGRLKEEALHRYEELFKEHQSKVVFALRFLPGLRSLSALLAGSHGMGFRRFIMLDLLAVLIQVPAYFFLGYHFHSAVTKVLSRVEFAKRAAILILAVLAVLALMIAAGRLFQFLRRPASAGQPLTPGYSIYLLLITVCAALGIIGVLIRFVG